MLGLFHVWTPAEPYGHDGDFTGIRNIVYAKANGKRVVDVMVNVDATDLSWGELEGEAQVALCYT